MKKDKPKIIKELGNCILVQSEANSWNLSNAFKNERKEGKNIITENFLKEHEITFEKAVEDNKTNKGCTNCKGCKNCTNCNECTNCDESGWCSKCKKCEKCLNCEDCKKCDDCYRCGDCYSCYNCTECANYAYRSNEDETYL